ncbi:MAG TPA: PAS domain-containing protein, partial [Acidobacteriaceae bacterium]
MLLLLALAVLAQQRKETLPRWAGNLIAILVVALTAATLLEYATARDLGLDQLIAHVPPEAAGDPVGRMSQGTAACGLLSALALLCVETSPFGTLFASLAGLLSMSALVGYLFDAGPLLGVRLLRSMAPRTAGSLFLVQIAYFLLRPQREPIRSLLHSARHHRFGAWFVLGTCLLPLLLGLPIATLYRHGWFAAPFAFAVLVVLLVGAQAVLVSRNSRSLVLAEAKRTRVEAERLLLAEKNQQQYVTLVASQKRAAESEAHFRLIANALPALVSYIDRDLRYVRVNRTYEEWFGRPASAIEGQLLEDVLGPSGANVRRHLESSLRGEPQQFEAQVRTAQGERTLSISHIPDIDDHGEVRGVIVQANDITARKQAEAALRQTEKLAAVGKLASSIAHEINNPLEAVTNLLYLANSSDNLTEIRFHLETAEQELARVSAIANQTLRFHRQASAPVKVTAHDLLETVMAIYQGRLHAMGIRIEQKHATSKPVPCMDGEIRQVLNNLVGNAIDAMQGSRGRLLLRSHGATDWRTGRRG